MTINQKIEGLISFASNSPGTPTGYGQQASYLVNNMVKSGLTVAAMSNYGHEGGIEKLRIDGGNKIPHYPKSFTGYSVDSLPLNHQHFKKQNPNLKDAIFILYDSWVYNQGKFDDTEIISWAPVDHITMPPLVHKFLAQPNVTAISMSPDGKRQMDSSQIESTYIPHSIDTRIFLPRTKIRSKETRADFLMLEPDDFLVGMVAANKSNGVVHRKAFAENILAFSIFQKKHTNAKLYIHSEASKLMGGFNLINLLKSCGVPSEAVIFPDPLELRYGMLKQDLASLYSAFDVLLAPSYGEGFGVPTVEAQACGTRVIVSNWAASQDLAGEDSWKVEGMPFWDEAQTAWYKVPIVESIVEALEKAYESDRGVSQSSIEFASQFEDKKVYAEKWEPFLRNYFAG